MRCDPCWDGKHYKCRRGDCSCPDCAAPPPDKPAKEPRPRKPRVHRNTGRTGKAGTQPWSEAEKDQIAADILRLLQEIRLRQIQETVEHEVRETFRVAAVKRADAVVDAWLRGGDVDQEPGEQGDVERHAGPEEPGTDF